MSEQKRRPLIEYAVIKPAIDAVALGMAIGLPAAFSGKFLEGFVFGSSASLGVYWLRGNVNSTKRKVAQKRGDFVTVNSAKGSRQVRRFEQIAPGYITRQPILFDMLGLFKKKSDPQFKKPPANPINRPNTLAEFQFISYDKRGNEVQILSSEFWNFLNRAWIYRDRGKGLGERFWGVRNKNRWPQWYPGPFFYEACLRLIVQAQRGLGIQLIVALGYQQIGLKWGQRKTYDHVITWYSES